MPKTEAKGLTGLVERLRELGEYAEGVPDLSDADVLTINEARGRIEALEAHIAKNSETDARVMADALWAQSRAELSRDAALKRLAEIEGITSEAFDTAEYVGIKKQMELKIAKVYRIAALAKEKA